HGERGENASRMEPAHAALENAGPVEVAGLQQRAGLVRAVIKHDGTADSMSAIAVDGGDVRAAHAVVLEPFVKGPHSRLADPRLHELADAVVDHRGGDARAEAETVRQVRRPVVFAPGNVYVERARLPQG